MPDRYAVIWTRGPSGPIKMGNLIATEHETRFSYSAEFLQQQQLPGFALLANPSLVGDNPVVHPASERLPLHPRLLALIPGQGINNIQRRIYTQILAKYETPPAPGFDSEWELLMLSGRNGIGHIDVFRDDREAERWYQQDHDSNVVVGTHSNFWHFAKNDIAYAQQQDEFDALALIGPTPSVGGMIPKILVSIPDTRDWDGSVAAPGVGHIENQAFTDVIVKLEYPEYAGLAALEALCFDVHREAGFRVPRYWRSQIDGMNVIAIERFDRTQQGMPIPMESFFSVMASGSKNVRGAVDTDMESVGQMLEKLPTVVNLDPKQAQTEIYRRLCMAILTGNGDMHLENLAFLGGADEAQVSPVYDPTPMRAWPQHNLLSAIPFVIDKDQGSIGDNLVRLGQSFGLTPGDAADQLSELMASTADYGDRVMACEPVPIANREALAAIIKDLRAKLTLSRSQS